MNHGPVPRHSAASMLKATGMTGHLPQVVVDDLSGWSHPAGSECLRLRPLRADADALAALLQSRLDAAGVDPSAHFGIRLALEEALSTAFTHGSANQPDAYIIVTLRVTPDSLYLSIADQGPGFTPDAVPDPTEDGNLEIASGRGLLLMRAYMDSVEFNPRGNAVRFTKSFHDSG